MAREKEREQNRLRQKRMEEDRKRRMEDLNHVRDQEEEDDLVRFTVLAGLAALVAYGAFRAAFN